jgi:hypothetical protein
LLGFGRFALSQLDSGADLRTTDLSSEELSYIYRDAKIAEDRRCEIKSKRAGKMPAL